MITKLFPMHAVLTMKTGICMGDFGAAHELMEWVLGHPVWTHEMPSYCKSIKAKLAELFPHLPSEAKGENWKQVLANAIESHGSEIEVPQGNAERTSNPIETAEAIFGKDRVVAAVV